MPSPSPDQPAPAPVQAALSDAAGRLGLSADQLRIERLEQRQWPDTSLGCPRPEVLYAQVLTPGYLVVLSGGGKQLEYHTDERGRAVLCQER